MTKASPRPVMRSLRWVLKRPGPPLKLEPGYGSNRGDGGSAAAQLFYSCNSKVTHKGLPSNSKTTSIILPPPRERVS